MPPAMISGTVTGIDRKSGEDFVRAWLVTDRDEALAVILHPKSTERSSPTWLRKEPG